MLISFIIPVYNGEKYINQCISTLKAQTNENWEAIFVNDGSTDSSVELIEFASNKDRRIKCFSQKNQGAAAARNLGVKLSSGDFLSFLDVDDTLSEHFVARMSDLLVEDIDIVVSTFNIVKDNSVIKRKKVVPGLLYATEFLKLVLTGKYGWELCAKLYRKKIFENKILTPNNFRIGEDAAIFVQLITFSRRIKIINEALYNYIQYDNSASHIRSKVYAHETLMAGYFIDSYLKEKSFYNDIKTEISAMYLLFFSNSTRKAYLGFSDDLVKYIYTEHLNYKSLSLIPLCKRIYILISFYFGKIFSHII